MDKIKNKASQVHNSKYDYSLWPEKVYISKKYDIICPEHGIFNQKLDSHIRLKTGCPKCSGKNLSIKEWINKASQVHNSKYDYSLIKDYKGVMNKYHIKCPEHGVWEVTLDNHINKKSGCPKCKGIGLNREEKLQEINKIHNSKYDYSLLPENIIDKEKYDIICHEHGIFRQEWNNHKSGQNCPKCSNLGRKKRTKESIIDQIKALKTGYKYYWDTYIDYYVSMDIECSKHGIFKQTVANHLFGQRCPKCVRSMGEEKIEEILKSKKISYITQKTFEGCINPKTGYKLRFDFYIPEKNMLIEYDGELHYKSVKWFGGDKTLEKYQYLDNIKNKYCSDNNIDLLRIPYFKQNVINNMIDKYFTNYDNRNINKIDIFLKSLNVKYLKKKNKFIGDNIEIIYINSEKYKTDYSKRFNIKGINKNYFINTSKENQEKGIRTIWIKDFEIEDERKWNVIKSYLKSFYNIIDNKIYARDCEFREVNNKDARSFEDINSFYGKRNSSFNVGLYVKKNINNIPKNTLVMLYTFGNPYFSKNKYNLEVLRASTLLNTQVIGGSSKLLKNFYKKNHSIKIKNRIIPVDTVIFYVDADHNTGSSLEKIGFEFKEWKEPGFMNYCVKTRKASHRQPMKHKEIMDKIKKREIIEIANAGVKTYISNREMILGK